MAKPSIAHLERRKIEAEISIPMVQAFQRPIGKEHAKEIAREVTFELARKDGERWAQQFGQDLPAMGRASGVRAGGAVLRLNRPV